MAAQQLPTASGRGKQPAEVDSRSNSVAQLPTLQEERAGSTSPDQVSTKFTLSCCSTASAQKHSLGVTAEPRPRTTILWG